MQRTMTLLAAGLFPAAGPALQMARDVESYTQRAIVAGFTPQAAKVILDAEVEKANRTADLRWSDALAAADRKVLWGCSPV